MSNVRGLLEFLWFTKELDRPAATAPSSSHHSLNSPRDLPHLTKVQAGKALLLTPSSTRRGGNDEKKAGYWRGTVSEAVATTMAEY